MIGATRSRIVLIFTFAVAVTIVVVLCTQIDLPTTWRQVKHVGLFGAFLLLIDMTLALMGPCVAWHILMRTEGINVGLGTTFRSALMGHAVNLISPLMYFGGEGVRTLHIARISGAPHARVLATIAAGEFQQLVSFCTSIVAAVIVVIASRGSGNLPLVWMTAGAVFLVALVVMILSVVLMDVRVLQRSVGFLRRCGFFTDRLASLQNAASETEEIVHSLIVRHKAAFLISQSVVFLSPLAQFALPAIFFWLLGISLPSLSQLASFYVLVQLLFMLPMTPAGLGIYESGIVGIFGLHGWAIPDGAAYAILIRLDDVLFSIGGAALLARFGLVTNEHFSPSPQVEVRVTPVIPSVNAETEEEDVPR